MELKDNKIILEKDASELDIFAIKFLKILEKHIEYVVVSGYVSILLGRTRATDDIDTFVKRMTKEKFSVLYEELQKNGFWCLNAITLDEVFSYLGDGYSIRFAENEKGTPNFEVRFPKDSLDEETFDNFIIVEFPNKEHIKISSLERQIAFKRYYLGTEKDNEDALHIEELFKGKIDFNKVNKYKQFIEERKKRQKIYGK